MARGLQKAQSQQKNAEKLKKAAGGSSNLKAQAAAVKLVCPACRLPVANRNNLEEHFNAKHSGMSFSFLFASLPLSLLTLVSSALPTPDFAALEAAAIAAAPAPPAKKK